MKKLFPIILILIYSACESPNVLLTKPANDTSKVIELALRTALEHHNLPDYGALFKNNPFDDSVLITSDSIPIKLIPENVGTIKFKIVPSAEMCQLLKSFSTGREAPNYLELHRFSKSDSGFYVHINNFSCYPFGGGGSISLQITKMKDSIWVSHRSSSSIN